MTSPAVPVRPNGSAAAAILSAGLGCFAIAIFSILGDHSASFKSMLTFYPPTGVLSGVTTLAVTIWLAAWLLLDLRWRRRSVSAKPVCATAIALLALALLLTFPPLAGIF